MEYTPPIFNVTIGTFSFIAKKWSVGVKWLWNGRFYGKSLGEVKHA